MIIKLLNKVHIQVPSERLGKKMFFEGLFDMPNNIYRQNCRKKYLCLGVLKKQISGTDCFRYIMPTGIVRKLFKKKPRKGNLSS